MKESAACQKQSPAARMRRAIGFEKPRAIDGGVDLRRR
jgi:hypothetical protein